MNENEEDFFITYTNCPVMEHEQKYNTFLKSQRVYGPEGMTHTPSTYISRLPLKPDNIANHTDPDKNFDRLAQDESEKDSGPDEIENHRNSLFQAVLAQIADGTPLSKVGGLDLINEEVKRISPTVSYELSTDGTGNERLTSTTYIQQYKYDTKSDYLFNLACWSLSAFLSVKGNARKIKLCHYCDLFYVAKKLNPRQKYCRTCSPKNKMTPEERRIYMKELRKEKKRKKERKREREVNRSMIEDKLTRKEAEELVDEKKT